MRKTSKNKTANDPQLLIDLKPFYDCQSDSDSGEKLLKFGNQQKSKQSRSKSQNINDPIDTYYCTPTTASKYKNENEDYYSVQNYEDYDYSEYDTVGARKISSNSNQHHTHHRQKRRHHQHNHRHRPNSQSSKQHKSSHHNDNLKVRYQQKEIENGFENDYNYLKIPYKNNNKDDNVNYEIEPSTPSFEDMYHFTCKQFTNNQNNQITNRDIKYKKTQEKHFYNNNNYPETIVKTKMVFHDSDQLDDSLNLFIEEEEYYENKRRARKHHHKQKHSHRKNHKERSAPFEINNDDYNYRNSNNQIVFNKPYRKPLNQDYQKYMVSNNKNEEDQDIDINNNLDNIVYADNEQLEKNSFSAEYSIFDFSEKSPPATHTYQQNNSPPNMINYATITFANPRKEIPSPNIENKNRTANMKFVQSEEILSGKSNDVLGSFGDQEVEENEPPTFSDLNFNEDINLKITVQDANENNQEKVHEFNIYSWKDSQKPGNSPEKIEFEEEEEEIENNFIEIKDEAEDATKKLKFHFEAKIPQAEQEEKVSSPNSKKSPNSGKNSSAKNSPNSRYKSPPSSKNNIPKNSHASNSKLNGSPNRVRNLNNSKNYNNEEESENDVASFCDVSTSFDSPNNSDENERKKYKTAEISVTLKDIRESVGNANKSVKKRKKSPRKKNQSNDSTIVTTHRRRMKRSAYRKTLVHKCVQTDEVDNPTMTLAMITSF